MPGLSFRGYRDTSDVEMMSRVSHLSWKADGVEWFVTPEDMLSRLQDISDHDHRADILIAEVDGETVGYSELDWSSSDDDPKYYGHSVNILPQWRDKELMEAMFKSNETRLQEISSHHPVSGRCYIKLWAFDGPNDWRRIVESSGYSPMWHLLEMAHNDLGSVRDVPPPDGLDYGPVISEDYPKIWALFRECFSHEQWSSPERWSEEEYDEWTRSANFSPGLWKVARAGSDIVGVVESFISEKQCEAYGRRVAYSNRVCVRDGWRRKGVATYLLTSSLKQLRAMGVEEVSLDTEVENKSSAMRVYMGVGFTTRRTFTFFARPL